MNDVKMFPVMNADPKCRYEKDYVPMDWVLKHEQQCLNNHYQDVATLARRGGLSHKELYAVLNDMSFYDVKMSGAECKKFIRDKIDAWHKDSFLDFTQYLDKLNTIAQNVTHENFVEIQKLQADILNTYTFGALTDREKRTLYNVSEIIMDTMRKELSGDK